MPFHHNSYRIGWICALPIEMAAAKCMLDESHPDLEQPRTDTNSYALGSIGSHNIVVACLPSGIYGTTSAAIVAKQMMTTFPNLSFGLMVGIGGGVPAISRSVPDIRLGDVVIGIPSGSYGGVVNYDYGKTLENGVFLPTGSLNHPPTSLLTAVSNLRSSYVMAQGQISRILDQAIDKHPNFRSPGAENDILHDTCSNPDVIIAEAPVVKRSPRVSEAPELHYGTIASGNRLIKHGKTRDQLALQHDIYSFEMEAAGLMDIDHFPCLAIRGISDYADEFKAKEWQPYAAITAAAYAKELLNIVPKSHVEEARSEPISAQTSAASHTSPLPAGILDQVFPVKINFIGSLTTDTLWPRQNFHALPGGPVSDQLALVQRSVPHEITLSVPGYTKLFSNASSKGDDGHENSHIITVDRSSSCTLNNSSDWFEEMSSQKKTRQWIEKQLNRSKEIIYLVVGFRSMWHRDIDISSSADDSDSDSKTQSCVGEVVYAVQYRQLKFKWYRRKDIDSASLQKGNCWQSMYTARGDYGEDPDEAEDFLEVTLNEDVSEASLNADPEA